MMGVLLSLLSLTSSLKDSSFDATVLAAKCRVNKNETDLKKTFCEPAEGLADHGITLMPVVRKQGMVRYGTVWYCMVRYGTLG